MQDTTRGSTGVIVKSLSERSRGQNGANMLSIGMAPPDVGRFEGKIETETREFATKGPSTPKGRKRAEFKIR